MRRREEDEEAAENEDDIAEEAKREIDDEDSDSDGTPRKGSQRRPSRMWIAASACQGAKPPGRNRRIFARTACDSSGCATGCCCCCCCRLCNAGRAATRPHMPHGPQPHGPHKPHKSHGPWVPGQDPAHNPSHMSHESHTCNTSMGQAFASHNSGRTSRVGHTSHGPCRTSHHPTGHCEPWRGAPGRLSSERLGRLPRPNSAAFPSKDSCGNTGLGA